MTRTKLPLILAAVAVLTWVLLAGVLAARAQQLSGLKVDQLVLQASVKAGATATHFIHVTNGEAADVSVEVRGIGQAPDGSFQSFQAENDENIYSARGFITVSPADFHLEPNIPQRVTVRVDAPADVGAGGRYATLYVRKSGADAQDENVQITSAIAVSVVLAVSDGGTLETSGSISAFELGDLTSGDPVSVSTVLENTGNFHYKAFAQATLRDGSGQQYSWTRTQLSDASILPGYSRQFDLQLRPTGELPAGTYVVGLELIGANGRTIDSRTEQVIIAAPVFFKDSSSRVSGAPGDAPSTGAAPGAGQAASGASLPWAALLAVAAGVAALIFIAIVLPRSRARRERKPAQ